MTISLLNTPQFNCDMPVAELHQFIDEKNFTSDKFKVNKLIDIYRLIRWNKKYIKLSNKDLKQKSEITKRHIYLLEMKRNPKHQGILRKECSKLQLGDFESNHDFTSDCYTFTQKDKILKDLNQTKKEREINKKNSLFLTRNNLSHKDKMEIISTARNINNIFKEHPERFIESKIGLAKPILDPVNKIIYKVGKTPDILNYALIIRKTMEEESLDNLILPTREFFRERYLANRYLSNPLSSPVIIENLEENLLSFAEAHKLYINSPDLFNKAIINITKLFLKAEIGDTCYGEGQYHFMFRKSKNLGQPFYAGCKCNFNNLVVKSSKDNEGKEIVKFVLVDLDVVRKPDHTTIENLLRMFPKHSELIKQTVKDSGSRLLEEYDLTNTERIDEVDEGIVFFRNELTEKYLEDVKEFKDNLVKQHMLVTDILKKSEKAKFYNDIDIK